MFYFIIGLTTGIVIGYLVNSLVRVFKNGLKFNTFGYTIEVTKEKKKKSMHLIHLKHNLKRKRYQLQHLIVIYAMVKICSLEGLKI